MKKLMMACCLLAGGLMAESRLAMTAEVAGFGDISKKVTKLGAMINNPIVPTLLLGSGQQKLAEQYGRFRSDAPIYWQFYADTEAFVKSAKAAKSGKDEGEAKKHCVGVLIYPSADGAARMALNNPGTEKLDDGTLRIKSGKKARWVKFSGDGRYCSIAPSAEWARRAIADFESAASGRRLRAGKEPPVARLELTGEGLAFIAASQKVNGSGSTGLAAQTKSAFLQGLQAMREKRGEAALIGRCGGATLTLDLNDAGVVADCVIGMKPGVKPPLCAGTALPAGSLDAMTAQSYLFGASMTLFHGAYRWESEGDFKADMKGYAGLLRNELVADVKGNKELSKYAAALTELAKAAADYLEACDYPAAGDWSAISLAFDAAKHPYLLTKGRARKAEKLCENGNRFMDRLAAALDRQYPGRGIVAKAADGYVIDWAAAVDAGVADSGKAKDDEVAKAAKNAKATLGQILGATKTETATKAAGEGFEGYAAAPGFKCPAGGGVGEARVAAALPETRAERPAAVVYLPLYALARDALLPILAKLAPKDEAKQFEALIKAMPPAEADGAVAAAGWRGGDGSLRGVLRITAGELRNFGAAFNAFTAAQMSNAADDDE